MPIRYRGDDKESYRWTYLNKNNLSEDDYSQLIEFTRVMSLNGNSFHEQIDEVMDVDQWLRAFAFSVITGHGDNYGSDGSQHNLQLYVRPSDNRVLFFPHDLDAFFSITRPLVGNGDLQRLIQVPDREHMYYGHVHDMIQTTFNEQYMTRWTDHYRTLLPQQRFDSHLRELVRRSDYLLSQIERVAPPIDFSVIVDQPNVDTKVATIRGDGWINVREIRLQGSLEGLNVEWTDVTKWQAEVPLAQGLNSLVAEAYDFQGNRIASVPFEIRSTAANPVSSSLVITEMDYNPGQPTQEELAVDDGLDNEDFEFIELTNVGDTSLNLMGVHFSAGIDFTFPTVIVPPQESIVVVQDATAFRLRYGDQIVIAGEFNDGRLSNDGERLALVDGLGNTVFDFTYDDASPWPSSADGVGATLELIDAASPQDMLGKHYAWRGSERWGGTPGRLGGSEEWAIVINGRF